MRRREMVAAAAMAVFSLSGEAAPKGGGTSPCREYVNNGFRAPALEVQEKIPGFLWLEAEYFSEYGGWKVDTQFTQVVVALELCLLEVLGTEGVGVDDDGSLRLGILQLRLQRCSIHSHQHVTQVARRVYLAGTDVYLET